MRKSSLVGLDETLSYVMALKLYTCILAFWHIFDCIRGSDYLHRPFLPSGRPERTDSYS